MKREKNHSYASFKFEPIVVTIFNFYFNIYISKIRYFKSLHSGSKVYIANLN